MFATFLIKFLESGFNENNNKSHKNPQLKCLKKNLGKTLSISFKQNFFSFFHEKLHQTPELLTHFHFQF